jgi:hypothetical protein
MSGIFTNRPEELEVKNEVGNPISTANAELQTYLTENIGLNIDDKANNDNDELGVISFIKGIFGKIKTILDRTPILQNGNVPVYVNNPIKKISVEEIHKGDGEVFTILADDNVTSFSLIADNPLAQIENVNLGVTQSVNAISEDYYGSILTTNLTYRFVGSKGIVTINRLIN